MTARRRDIGRTLAAMFRPRLQRPTVVALAAVAVVACTGQSSSGVSSPTSAVDGSPAPQSTSVADATSPATSQPSSDVVDEPVPADEPQFVPEQIEWTEFNDDVDVATLEVPVDYDDPAGPRFELFLARHRALDPDARIGTIVVNPGGPGRAGVDYAIAAAHVYDAELLQRFDIVAWDPRGTGESTPTIDCIDDYDPYFTAVDSTPANDAEHDAIIATARAFTEACIARNGDILDSVGTNNSARDIDSIRRALGEEILSYFGFSYGSELGATWATLFPETVRAAVLDGGTDPAAGALESSIQQSRGFEAALNTFFQRCAADESCAFGHNGDPRAAYLDLLAALATQPLVVDPDRPPVNRDVATLATYQAMYADTYWPALERALASAQFGDGAGLLELHDGYYRRHRDGTYPNFLEAFQVISCADVAERFTIDEADAQVPALHEAAPTLIPADSTGSYFCTFFPPAGDPRIEITGQGAGPIVVIGTTGDPATPLESTAALAETLEDGRLVVVDADQHLGYGANACINELVNRYLVDLEAPDDGTECG